PMTPLHNTRILDLTRLLPGAVCTLLLRDLGAEIIKVEDPQTGDYARLMPPLIDGMGAFFQASSRGKKSIAINLKSTAGQAVLHRLISSADVLIEGFRPGVTVRLGADYETLSAVNPRLVYCSLSGWGQTGPYAHLSGHDLNYIARNGLLGADLAPATPGAQAADVSGAYVAVMGILAALLQRQQTGEGDCLDVALSEAAMPLALAAWVEAQTTPPNDGFISLRGESASYRVYSCADGEPVALGAVEAKFWANFCRAVEQPEWIAQQFDRRRQPALIDEVAALFKSKTADDWSAVLAGADCCFSRVIAPDQLLDDPQIAARGMVGLDERGVPWMRSPIRLRGDATTRQPAPAPAHGEHTIESLREIGYSPADIERLLADNVIRQAP
ncbi:MAG: CoA transferase, partial [Chloroflexi bacterium]|nr:CoA transferase [Chloroflexota bacterium]